MLAADHAAQLRKPIVMVKVGRTAAGESMAASHTGHLTGSDAVTIGGLPPVRRDARRRPRRAARRLGRTRAHAARRRCRRGQREAAQPGICVYAISGGTGAHMADMVAAAGLRIPDLTTRVATTAARWSHPCATCACRTRSTAADLRSPIARGRQILDVILADKNIDILVIPITGAVATFSEPFTRDIIEVSRDHDEADLRDLGCAVGHRRHVLQAAARRRPAGIPHVRQLRRRGEGVPGLLDVRGPLPVAVRRRADRTVARGEEGTSIARRPHERARRCRSGSSSSC